MDLCKALVVSNPVEPCDVVLVLAGLPERKSYGLELLRSGATPKVILSVARFEIRKFAATALGESAMIDYAQRVPAVERHLFVEVNAAGATWKPARLPGLGTFRELCGLAHDLRDDAAKVGIVSTSIHMRRIRYCCQHITRLRLCQIRLYPVPEACSSFRQRDWWRSAFGRKYVASEWMKLAWYYLHFRGCGEL